MPGPLGVPPGVGAPPAPPGEVCAVLSVKGPCGGAPPGRGFLGSRPQNRMRGVWRGGEQLSHQSLFPASGVYF